ncbi:MAG: ribosome biogenesis GTPase Der [Ignavibacteriales bacterium]|nr:ribosome biogenesis GTPase Der [Ignavibacteriales bacterium]
MSIPIVAIIGRPNVGKSTFFNRILGVREAIVYGTPGVTRDRKYAEAEWCGKTFLIIDTGGYVPTSEDVFEKAIREQAAIAIEEADAVVFVVDAVDGVMPLDKEIANHLRQSEKPVLLVANKIDSANRENLTAEFFSLGLGTPFGLSALGGRQIGDFLDLLTESFKKRGRTKKEKRLQVAIIGKPNVGKSSLVNALLGKSRLVVTDIPGTTRDPIDSILYHNGEEIVIVDTAGLRKRSKVQESIEFYSTLRALRAIDRCDVAVILLDAEDGLNKQDMQIIDETMHRHRPVLIAVNKWDLVEKETNTARNIERVIKQKLGLYDFLPVIFISALTKQRISKVIEKAQSIHQEQSRKLTTSKLNKVMLPEIERYPPKVSASKEVKIKYVTQIKTSPPMFAFFCNEPQLVQESYRRFLQNRLREHFGFEGVPIGVVFKKK